MIIVPHESLEPDTLRALVEEFVTRDGAIQGHRDATLDARVREVLAQLHKGTVKIVFDPQSESCTLVSKKDLTAGFNESVPPEGGSTPADFDP